MKLAILQAYFSKYKQHLYDRTIEVFLFCINVLMSFVNNIEFSITVAHINRHFRKGLQWFFFSDIM